MRGDLEKALYGRLRSPERVRFGVSPTAVERRRERLAPGQVAPAEADFAGAGLPQLGDDDPARGPVATDNAEPVHAVRYREAEAGQCLCR